MNSDSHILFVSAGLEKPKKRDTILSRRQQYLNYGALTLATILDAKGYTVKLFHGGHSEPELFAKKLHQDGMISSKYPLMLSMQSFYALSWTKIFTQTVKTLVPSITIILGGRWVVGSDPDWLKEKLPFVDIIVGGLCEDKIVNLAESKNIDHIRVSQEAAAPFSLKHKLIDNYREFQPNVEASRGCGMGCSFCEERDVPLTSLKEPALLARQIQDVASQYGDASVRPYIQSSFFAPNKKWAERFSEAVLGYKRKISWRCETRVDSIKPESISELASGGLKAIDLGLESASPSQLLNMNKSKVPDKYLRQASNLLAACKDNGVWVKINFLIYAGESEKTFNETREWLDDHADCIKGISVGPVVVFGSPKTAKEYTSSILAAGGSLVDPEQLHNSGVGYIHPSSSISAEEAEQLCLDTSRRFMTQVDYFDLKSFSYYPRSYSYADFLADIQENGTENLPFVVL